ncbi:MAG: hypothetical protein AB1758_15620, partial [Candidatus Eremiobacterota bacterium]
YAALLALAGCSLAGSRRGEFEAVMSPSQRRMGTVHRTVLLAKMALVAGTCALLFGPWATLFKLPPWVPALCLAGLAAVAALVLNRAGDLVEGVLRSESSSKG